MASSRLVVSNVFPDDPISLFCKSVGVKEDDLGVRGDVLL